MPHPPTTFGILAVKDRLTELSFKHGNLHCRNIFRVGVSNNTCTYKEKCMVKVTLYKKIIFSSKFHNSL